MNRPGTPNVADEPASVWSAILLVVSGPMLWALHFLLIYGPQSTLCVLAPRFLPAVRGWHVTAIVGLVTLAVLAALILVLRRHGRLLEARGTFSPARNFLLASARLLTILSLVAVLWAGAVALMLDPCGNLRASQASIAGSLPG
jgi:hypothetical protein